MSNTPPNPWPGTYQDFCAEVRRARLAAGLDVPNTARLIGITPRVLDSIEAGRNCRGENYLAVERWLREKPRPVVTFTFGGLQITVETRRGGEIVSVTDSQGHTWTRQA